MSRIVNSQNIQQRVTPLYQNGYMRGNPRVKYDKESELLDKILKFERFGEKAYMLRGRIWKQKNRC